MEKKSIKIEIKNRWTGKVLFEYEKEDNTIKETVVEAVKNSADLRGADLRGADLGGADLRGAYLGGADLRGAKNVPFIPMMCPSDGAFIGWKKVRENGVYLVKLEICEDSKRSSASRMKCRCDKAKVLQIVEIKSGKEMQTVTNTKYVTTEYKVGSMVYADKWDDNRWNECSHGIHFFINRQEAEEYDI